MAVRKIEIHHEPAITLRYVDLENGRLHYASLFAAYQNSRFGRFHSKQAPRYSQRYGYEPAQMIADLGDDVHPVKHMRHTEQNILRPFLNHQNRSRDEEFEYMTPEQIVALRSGALLHDIGECEHPDIKESTGSLVGDAFYETKTREDDAKEAVIRGYLYEELYREVDQSVLEAAEDVIAGSRNEFVRGAFDTVERIGYYETAMTAGKIALEHVESENSKDTPERIMLLGRLAVRVRDNHHSTLTERAEMYPYAGMVIDRYKLRDGWVDSQLREFAEEHS